MSIRVLLREYPHRSLALVTPSHALIFRHSPSTNDAIANGSLSSVQNIQTRTSLDGASAPRCMVEFADSSTLDLTDYRTLSPLPIHGTLGLITINNDVFICVVTGTTRVASVRPGETVEKIHGVEFHCLNSSEYDNTFTDHSDPYDPEGQEYGQNLSRRDPMVEHPCLELQKMLSDGSFYYSTDFDLTNRLQDRGTESSTFDIENLDQSFLWNSYMIEPLLKFRSRLVAHERDILDRSRILTSAIRGFVLTITIPASSAPLRTSKTGLPSSLTLISRLSCRRAGTRFNSRGIDDDGNVANFVESETIYWSPSGGAQHDITTSERPTGICFSYAQIRGSIPIFWEQQAGLLPGQQKITITRSAQGTQPAFDKHFAELEQNYGSVHIVNLLSKTKTNEVELTRLYRNGIKYSALNRRAGEDSQDHQLLIETEFDFHAETKGPNGYEAASMIRQLIEDSAEGFAYYYCEEVEEPTEEEHEEMRRRTIVAVQQNGVFRTNCLDCLDRTNLIQTIISQMALEAFLGHQQERAASDFWMRHSSLWADNGDALSRIYAGTGALKSSFTRRGKMSLAGTIADARKSATRIYINNFADKGRQNTIDVLLGRLVGQTPVYLFDPMNDYVTAELARRSAEYQSSKSINIWCGTFNLNGRTSGIDEDLSSWLCPDMDPSQENPEIVAVGFQEIVELSPQQIMNSDPTRKQSWERAVKRTLNAKARATGNDKYVLLRSGQLVGAALCIFVKSSAIANIKNVEGGLKKTGMSGMAGNKGAVAIRMEYANTQLCFVTAHLAAGFSNYEERNRDYTTIHNGLRFQRNRGIDDHDTVIWMGDFNYRIGLNSEKVRQLIKVGDLETLYENDQLNLQMVAGLTFPFYSESRITFNPTYKFDLGNDTYDTSEKARIPAWTDRILRKGTNLRQINYNIAHLRFSDHRPVFATFQCTISVVDEARRESLSRRIYEKRRADVGITTANNQNDDTDDEDLIGYDPIEPGLPPASSDTRKWWLDNSQPARSNIQPPQKGLIPNPQRPSNPYELTDEPDWVTVPSMSSNERKAVSEPPPPPKPRRPVSNSLNGETRPTSAKSAVSELSRNFSQSSLHDGAPDARVPRKLSTLVDHRLSTSTTTSIKKAAPPVARKPVHLTTSTTSSPTLSTASIVAPLSRSPLLAPSQTARTSIIDHTGFAPPPRRATGILPPPGASYGRRDIADRRDIPSSSPASLSRKSMDGKTNVGLRNGHMNDDDNDGFRPKLPPRRPTADLLGSNGDDDAMGSWQALKPS